jgi:hypothetical protein
MKRIADMSRTEIVSMLEKGNMSAHARAFVADLFETYEAEEVPEILATLSRAAHALRDKPTDFDMMSLTLRELGPIVGGSGGELPEIPGLSDRIEGFYDLPLRELERHVGALEAQYYLRKYVEQLDAKHAKSCAALAARFR